MVGEKGVNLRKNARVIQRNHLVFINYDVTLAET